MAENTLVNWFESRRGEEVSAWFTVTQDMVDRFADLTGDHQWIHVDRARAAAESGFGGTIAHGFLVLSLVAQLFDGVPPDAPVSRGINYGIDRLRFTAPVPAGARIRGRRAVAGVMALPGGGAKVITSMTIEVEGSAKPACVFNGIVLYFP